MHWFAMVPPTKSQIAEARAAKVRAARQRIEAAEAKRREAKRQRDAAKAKRRGKS